MKLSLNNVVDAIELMYESGWTDGLPVVPPTWERVKQFTDHMHPRLPDELIAEVPPLGGRATLERVAVNAVMAGCLPEHMPVIITAIEALLDDRFNLRGVQCSTGIHTPLVIVNGPIAKQLNINSGYNCFGQGWRANATIGRAVKLVLVNLGGAIPGQTNKATFGHPGAYTYCVAEAEESNPWEPLHVELGFDTSDSTVSVFPGEAPHKAGARSFPVCRRVEQTGRSRIFVRTRQKACWIAPPRRPPAGRLSTSLPVAQVRRPLGRLPTGAGGQAPGGHPYHGGRWAGRPPLHVHPRLGVQAGYQEDSGSLRRLP